MIFVDTSAWFAVFVSGDADHQEAKTWLNQSNDKLITTDYIFDELLTLMKQRGAYNKALEIGEPFLFGEYADLLLVSQEDIESAWNVFKRFQDKGWSFTDCTSYVVMKKLEITRAFAFDEHFSQFGNVEVVP
jgi:uncharacterized protein